MYIDIEKLGFILDRDQIDELLYDSFWSYCYNEADTNAMKYETLKEMGFIVSYKKKEVIDLNALGKYNPRVQSQVLGILLEKYVLIDSDIISMEDDDLLKQFEEETEEDFYKNTEDLNTLNEKHKLLYDSMCAKSLEKCGIIKIKDKKAEITNKIQNDKEQYKGFVNLAITMISDNGEEYNPTVFEYLVGEGLIN